MDNIKVVVMREKPKKIGFNVGGNSGGRGALWEPRDTDGITWGVSYTHIHTLVEQKRNELCCERSEWWSYGSRKLDLLMNAYQSTLYIKDGRVKG